MSEIIQTLFTNIPFVICIIINLILGLVGGKTLIDSPGVSPVPLICPLQALQGIVGIISLSITRQAFTDSMKLAYGFYIAFAITSATFILPFCIKWIDDIIWYFKRK